MPSVGTRVRERMNLPPRKYQIQAVRFLEGNYGRGILGDSMGLGKTYEAIAYLAIHPEIRRVVVVCPASVKYQWQDMLRKTADLPSRVLEGRTPYRDTGGVSIINYDILAAATWPGGKRKKGVRPRFKWVEMLRREPIGLVILDEFHFIKNRSALRTQATKQLCKNVPHLIACSGTPIEKAPVEFFPILQIMAPGEFPGFWKYAMRYCNPRRAFRGRGWDFGGSANLDELHERTGPWIIRRLKSEVAKELPQKVRSVLPIGLSNRKEYNKAEQHYLQWVEENKGKKAKKKASAAIGLTKLGALKRVAGEGKVRAIGEWIKGYLEENDDKLVCFAVHHNVINCLAKMFPTAAVFTGKTRNRPATIHQFIQDPQCRLFIGQIKAAGVGVDGLHQVSSTAIFAELGWNFSEHGQAEDRILRIGQKATSVNIFYMVGRDTVEEPILELIQSKADIVSRVLHGSVLGPLFNRRGKQQNELLQD